MVAYLLGSDGSDADREVPTEEWGGRKGVKEEGAEDRTGPKEK